MKPFSLVILFIKNIFKSILRLIKKHLNIALIQYSNPTCNISLTVNIMECELNNNIAIYDNAIVKNCNIGCHTYIQKNSRIFNADIGNFCSIASNVSIAPGLHFRSGISTHPSFYLKNNPLTMTFSDEDTFETFKKVTIGHDVWIGENAIIMDGITVGTGAIIAASSVVTKNVEPYAIVAGVPAKVLKFRFKDDQISGLLESEWWDLSNKWLKDNHKLMRNPDKFIKQIKLKNETL
tara:strand:- start:269 stop:976 length:708 start_codon:yes stop_codon:yes gene_type:complete